MCVQYSVCTSYELGAPPPAPPARCSSQGEQGNVPITCQKRLATFADVSIFAHLPDRIDGRRIRSRVRYDVATDAPTTRSTCFAMSRGCLKVGRFVLKILKAEPSLDLF
jgi:hypothetical protein